MEQAADFGFDFQELSSNCENHIDAIKAAIAKHKDKIVREKCTNTTIFFNDGSSAEWIGNGWSIKK